MTATAPTWMEPGEFQFNVQTPANPEEYFRTGDAYTDIISVRINLATPFDITIDPIIEGKQEVVRGEIALRAEDTNELIGGIDISIYLENSTDRVDERSSKTNSSQKISFEFVSNPDPYGDSSVYGELTLKMSIGANYILSNESINLFNQEFNSGKKLDYTYTDEQFGPPWWVYVLAVLIIGAAATFVIMRRRSADAAKEIADIFSYTAELLAAGDSMREAIFQCYESLVHILMGRGFLRRDFETVREFEMAIRAALPDLSEEALTSLDSVFEEARYSRHEMSESDKANAQQALTRVVAEIGQLTDIPNR